MRVLVRDWTQLANRASDHLSRSLYISTPYPPITSAVRLATTNITVGSTYSNKLIVPPQKLPSPPPSYPVPRPFDARSLSTHILASALAGIRSSQRRS